jgi:Ca2+-binding RTX toxin-like protein
MALYDLSSGSVSNGSDIVFLSADNDIAYGYDGNDSIYGQGGRDLLFGGEGGDVLFAGNFPLPPSPDMANNEGDSTLFGETGNDVLVGGRGTDILTGNSGTDLFVLRHDDLVDSPERADVIVDFNPSEDFIGFTGGVYAEPDVSVGEIDFTFDGVTKPSTLLALGSGSQLGYSPGFFGIVYGVTPDEFASAYFNNHVVNVDEVLWTGAQPAWFLF